MFCCGLTFLSSLYPNCLNNTGTSQSCSLPPFCYQCVFILQGEVGDLFNMGCCMLCPSPRPPSSSSLFLVYLLSPSLTQFKAPWGVLGGDEGGRPLWGYHNNLAHELCCPFYPRLTHYSSPYYKTLSNTSKAVGSVALTPSGETETVRQSRSELCRAELSGCCVWGQEVLGVKDERGVVGEVIWNIFLLPLWSVCMLLLTSLKVKYRNMEQRNVNKQKVPTYWWGVQAEPHQLAILILSSSST